GKDGAYSLEGVPVRAAKLRVDAEGFLGVTVGPVDVRKHESVTLDALLPRESTLAGIVADEKGAAIEHAKVRVEIPPREGMGGMIAQFTGGAWKSAMSGAD